MVARIINWIMNMFARVISLFIRHLYKNPYGRFTYKYTNKVDFTFLRGLSKQSHMVVLLFVLSILYDRMEARLMGGNGELSIISPTVGPDLDIYSGLYSPLKNYGQYGFLTPESATNSLMNLYRGTHDQSKHFSPRKRKYSILF